MSSSHWAWTQARFAELYGTIHDPDGLVLTGARVTAVEMKTGLAREALTDDSGEYRFAALPPGKYQVKVEFDPLSEVTAHDVVLTVGQFAQLDFALPLATASFSVVVEESPRIVEREQTAQESTVAERSIDNLPINGRNYLEFVLLTPGATSENSLDTTTPAANPTSGLVITGQNPRSNYVTIDGVDNMDVAQLNVRPVLSQEAVQEFQINRSTYAAEFGRSRSGLVNIVSRSGGNEFHGSAFFLLRDESLDASNVFARPEDPEPTFERYQFGGSLGGPLRRDGTFFFTSFEGQRRDESAFVTFLDDPGVFRATASQQELFSALAAVGDPSLSTIAAIFADPGAGILNTTPATFPATLQRLEDESGVFPLESDSNVFSFRLDHEVSDSNRMFARFNLADVVSDNANLGGLRGFSNGVSFDIGTSSLVVGDTHFFSASALNDFRFQFYNHDIEVQVNQAEGPEIVIAGLAQIGRDFTNPTGYDLESFQFVDHVSWIGRKHQVKLGVDLNLIDASGFADVFKAGQFVFAEAIPLAAALDAVLGEGTTANLGALLATPADQGGLGRPDLLANLTAPMTALQAFNFGLPVVYFQGFGDTTSQFDFNQLALFFQDQWNPRPNLTFNLGLRYDHEWQAERVNLASASPPFTFENASPSDRNNLAPRIAFAWDLQNKARTVIRGGYGLYFGSLNQSLEFASTVLAGQIRQVFLPITGIPGVPATSIEVWQAFLQSGRLTEETLGTLGVVPGTTPGVLFPSDPNLEDPYSHQASLGVEHELSRHWSLSLSYLLNKGVHLVRIRDVNVRRTGLDSFALPGLDPRFLQLNLIESTGSSIYHGLTASLHKRFQEGLGFNLAYTLGKAIDDVSDFTIPLEAHNQLQLDWQRSLSTFDQRHRLVFNGILDTGAGAGTGSWKAFSRNWTVSPIVTWASGRPFTLLLGFDVNGDGHADSDRPRLIDGSLVGRNTGTGPAFFSTDLRLARRFQLAGDSVRLELIAEVFNLFNNDNYSEVNQIVAGVPLSNGHVKGSADTPSNQPLGFTSAFNPRQFQLGLRFHF